jgi:hypothetical protein
MKQFIALLFVVSIIAGNQRAFACTCVGGFTPTKRAEIVDVVFIGKVIRTDKTESGYDKVNKLEVSRSFKGNLGRSVDIHTGAGCEFVFRTGYEYLVYASKYQSYLRTNSCSGSHQLGTSEVDPTHSKFDLDEFKELETWQIMKAQPILSPCHSKTELNKSFNEFKKLLCGIEELNKKADRTLRPKQGLQKVKPVQRFNPFDVNEYFSILSHIRPPADQVLDYLYNDKFLPVLYLKKNSGHGFTDYDEYLKDIGGYNEAANREKAIPDELELDGSKESFIELILFKELAGKFHLPEPYLYSPAPFIATTDDIEKIIQQRTGSGHPMTEEQSSAARKISPKPVVVINDDSATVHVMAFSCRSGFIRKCYHIARKRPHNISECTKEILVKDTCGIEVD